MKRTITGFSLLLVLSSSLFGQEEVSGPRSPGDAQSTFVLHPDCAINIVASEPDVIDPVHVEFGPDGRLWVVEYSDYPNGPEASQPGASRIRVLTDVDGDGRYENPVIFAEKLLFANGLMLWKDGAFVTSNGKVLFLRDTTGDGRADEQQVWFEGFITENPQLRHNHPTLAIDNWIYISNGLRSGVVTIGPDHPFRTGDEKSVNLSGRDFRFDPLSNRFDAPSGPGQFGLTFDDFGNRFSCTNRNPNNMYMLEPAHLSRNPKLRVSKVFQEVSPSGPASKLFPIARTWTTSNLHANTFTAACGVLIYRGNELNSKFYGNSFTCDPTGNLVHRDVLSQNGSTFNSKPGRDGIEFLATKDEWFRPVNLHNGPDGALYVVDMYRAVIEHPQFMPEELKTRSDLGLGTDRGRIWRVVSRQDQQSNRVPNAFKEPSLDGLIPLLSHANAWHRDTARRLILEGDFDGTVAALSAVANDHANPNAAMIAQHLLNRIQQNGNSAAERTVLNVPSVEDGAIVDSRLLSTQIQLANQANNAAQYQSQWQQLLSLATSKSRPNWLDDHVVYQLMLAHNLYVRSDETSAQIAQLLSSKRCDHWLRTATLLGVGDATSKVRDGLLNEIVAVNHAEQFDHETALASLSELLALSPTVDFLTDAKLKLTASQKWSLAVRAFQANRSLAVNWIPSASKSSPESLQSAIQVCREAEAAVRDEAASDTVRVTAIRFMAWNNSRRASEVITASGVPVNEPFPNFTACLIDVLHSKESPTVHQAAIAALGQQGEPAGIDALANAYPQATPTTRRALISALATTGPGASRLLDEVEAKRVPVLDVSSGIVNSLKRNKTFGKRAASLLTVPVDANRAKIIAEFKACLKLKSDPLRGRSIFEKNCATCHKVGKVGVDVAPDISDSRTKTREFLLTNILDPNRAIDNNYFSFTILDTDGRVHTGIITSETETSITLKQPEGKVITLQRDEIEELKNNGVSLMPVGLEKTINDQQMADLISYIKNWRYLDGLVPKDVIK